MLAFYPRKANQESTMPKNKEKENGKLQVDFFKARDHKNEGNPEPCLPEINLEKRPEWV